MDRHGVHCVLLGMFMGVRLSVCMCVGMPVCVLLLVGGVAMHVGIFVPIFIDMFVGMFMTRLRKMGFLCRRFLHGDDFEGFDVSAATAFAHKISNTVMRFSFEPTPGLPRLLAA